MLCARFNLKSKRFGTEEADKVITAVYKKGESRIPALQLSDFFRNSGFASSSSSSSNSKNSSTKNTTSSLALDRTRLSKVAFPDISSREIKSRTKPKKKFNLKTNTKNRGMRGWSDDDNGGESSSDEDILNGLSLSQNCKEPVANDENESKHGGNYVFPLYLDYSKYILDPNRDTYRKKAVTLRERGKWVFDARSWSVRFGNKDKSRNDSDSDSEDSRGDKISEFKNGAVLNFRLGDSAENGNNKGVKEVHLSLDSSGRRGPELSFCSDNRIKLDGREVFSAGEALENRDEEKSDDNKNNDDSRDDTTCEVQTVDKRVDLAKLKNWFSERNVWTAIWRENGKDSDNTDNRPGSSTRNNQQTRIMIGLDDFPHNCLCDEILVSESSDYDGYFGFSAEGDLPSRNEISQMERDFDRNNRDRNRSSDRNDRNRSNERNRSRDRNNRDRDRERRGRDRVTNRDRDRDRERGNGDSNRNSSRNGTNSRNDDKPLDFFPTRNISRRERDESDFKQRRDNATAVCGVAVKGIRVQGGLVLKAGDITMYQTNRCQD